MDVFPHLDVFGSCAPALWLGNNYPLDSVVYNSHLLGSVGQEFSQDRMGMACIRSTVPGPQLKAEGRDPMKAHSLTCLEMDAGCWQRASVSLHVVSQLEPVWASSLHGGWILKANVEKMMRKGRRERNTSTTGKLYPLTS